MLKCVASRNAVSPPTCGIPRPISSRSNETFLAACIARMRFSAFFSSNPSSGSNSSFVSSKMSSKSEMRSCSIRILTVSRPIPPISSALLPAKWISLRACCSKEPATLQRCAASPGTRSILPSPPQSGERNGNFQTFALFGRNSLITETTSGMISPAFCKIIVSPTRMSFSFIKSSL